jgi:hypothetical protein
MPRPSVEALRADYDAAKAARVKAEATIKAARRTLADVDAALGALRECHAATVHSADEEERAARIVLAVRSDPAYPMLTARATAAQEDAARAQQAFRIETARLLRVAVQIGEAA